MCYSNISRNVSTTENKYLKYSLIEFIEGMLKVKCLKLLDKIQQ